MYPVVFYFCQVTFDTPRPPRADEAGGLDHALNRGNLRATIFHKDADFEAFERILYEALQIHQVELYSYQLMPNHYHLLLRPLVDGVMSRFMGCVGGDAYDALPRTLPHKWSGPCVPAAVQKLSDSG